ncbi:MAG TPA: cell division protein FtsQ/DivIB [Candidatus Binataceae bacterium]|nr:cell division protein FtsQ/DivIB [Candidatus Binataceae bacterium]
MAKRSGNKAAAGWNARMLGLVLCAFFVLGVITGFSTVGRAVALRVSGFISSFSGKIPHASFSWAPLNGWIDDQVHRAELRSGINFSALWRRPTSARANGSVVAIVERHDGFYALFSDGELRGPISPTATDDLPILSGNGVENARGSDLVEYAAVMVRAEAQLSHIVSEMNVDDDGTASLYLDRARTAVVFDLDQVPLELGRAAEILGQWHDREQMIAAIDMTTPGEAVVRVTETASVPHPAVNKVSDHASAGAASAPPATTLRSR